MWIVCHLSFPVKTPSFQVALRRLGASAQFPSIVGNACLFFAFALPSWSTCKNSQEFTIHSLVDLVFVMEIPFGALKYLIHVYMNVSRAVTFHQSEETCMGSTFNSVREAPRAPYFSSDNNGIGSKSGEQKIEGKGCS